MSKTLSNGVLSLRFMQNAQRAKQLKEVELQRAEVVDEGKWEVSQAVREAWGLTKERNEDLDPDVHEASYLPFLYPITDEDSLEDRSQITLGRRVFKPTTLDVPDDGAQGKDVPLASTSNNSSKPSKGRIHAHPHPVSISSLSKGRTTLLKGFDGHDESKNRQPQSKEIRVTRPTARDLIFDSGNVGVDLRDQLSTKAAPPVFLKPAGVDDPKEPGETGSPAEKTPSEIPTRHKLKKNKRVRDQDGAEDEEESVEKKSKKKKKKSSGSRG